MTGVWDLLSVETGCRRHSAARVKSSCALTNRMFSATFSSSPDSFSTPPASVRAEGDSAAQTLGFSGMMGHQGGAGRISRSPLPPTPGPTYPAVDTHTHTLPSQMPIGGGWGERGICRCLTLQSGDSFPDGEGSDPQLWSPCLLVAQLDREGRPRSGPRLKAASSLSLLATLSALPTPMEHLGKTPANHELR